MPQAIIDTFGALSEFCKTINDPGEDGWETITDSLMKTRGVPNERHLELDILEYESRELQERKSHVSVTLTVRTLLVVRFQSRRNITTLADKS